MDHQVIQLTHPGPSSSAEATSWSNDAGLFMCPSLYGAVYKGQLKKVKGELQHKHEIQYGQCDMHAVSVERNTIFHIAAEQGHHELIRELCAEFGYTAGPLLSSRNSAMDTPLHCAARAGHDRAVSALVDLARDCGESILGCKNEAGETALHLAAKHGHGAVVEALVSEAPELASELNCAGVSPLFLAARSKSVAAVRAITTKCRHASSIGPSSQNALHAAVFQTSGMVELLLEWDPSMAEKVDCNNSSPLHFASSDGNKSIVKAILRAAPRSTVYMKDSAGLSALHVAARMGHKRVVDKLIRTCLDAAELRDVHGRTFLHAAAMENQTSVVSLAIKKPMLGGLLNAQDRDGNTPLHLAVAAGASGIAVALVQSGKVQIDVMNNEGHTPIDLAAKSTNFFSKIVIVVTLTAFGVQSRPQRQDHLEKWSGREIAQLRERTSESLVVVAVLISTVSFAAAFNLPGGYDDKDGTAKLQGKPAYSFFIILDSVALITSVVAAILLVYGKASGSWKSFIMSLQFLWVSLVSVIVAFYASLVAVTSARSKTISLIYGVIYNGMYLLALYILHRIKPVSWKTIWGFLRRRSSLERRRITRQYPFAGTYSSNLLLLMAINIVVYVAIMITLFVIPRMPDHSYAPEKMKF